MQLDVLSRVLSAVALLLLLPVGLLLIQVVAAVLPRSNTRHFVPAVGPRPTVVILVPAHNEASSIAASLQTMKSQLGDRDRLLVVADNCGDETARVSAEAGADVVERNDLSKRGKGYALDHGIRSLEAAPPEVVIVVDADCELHPGSVDRLARLCLQAGRPVQALDLMHAPPAAGLKTRIAAFAWLVKNQVRPLGYHRMGLPCQLMGTGMAFPWPMIRDAPLASGHIVEDMRLGLDLAASGTAPMFCPEAKVTSVFPSHAQGIAEQRARWEHGHLGIILKEAPRALWRAVAHRRPSLAAMVFDLCVPPLSMLALLVSVLLGIEGGVLAFGGTALPLAITLLALGMLLLGVAIAWFAFGRHVVSARELMAAPLYVLAKLPLYARFFARRKSAWTRARRD